MELEQTTRRSYLAPLFFLSGISALIYQIVWLKYLGFVFGNTVHAAATLIAVYLAGLGLGAYFFGRENWPRRPLLVYALLEALIGVFAAFSPNAFAIIDRAYVLSFQHFLDSPVALALARIAAAAVVLLPPTILMGGTLPLLVRAMRRSVGGGDAVAVLYAANTFGATMGVALAGFVTIRLAGLLSSLFLGVMINFFLAFAAAVVAFKSGERESTAAVEQSAPNQAALRLGGAGLLLASLVMGLTSIADEVFWSRILVLHLGSSVYAYSLMLFSFLIGIAIGSALIVRYRGDRPGRLVGFVELALALVLALQIFYFTRFPDVLEFFATVFGSRTFTATLFTLLAAVLSALLIPTALMGATFPLIVRLYRDARAVSSSRAVGVVYLWNTIGSICGSLLAGFFLIRLIGSQNGLFAMAALNLMLAAFFLRTDRRWLWGCALGAVILGAAAFGARPNQVILSAGLFTDDNAKLLFFREDTTATVTLRQYPHDVLSLELNGVNVAGTSPDLIGTQKLQGHLPLLIHPHARTVLHIGFGSGGTAWAVSRHDVSRITVAEISPEVLETSDRFLRRVNHGVLHDPRLVARIADGRNYVLAAPEKFDVILSDSIHPRYAGNGSLYTRDYFELCRARLNPDGMVSMWLPIYALTQRNYLMILRAFRDVFPNSTVWYVPATPNAYTIVIGRLEQGALPLERMKGRMTPVVAQELAAIGVHDVYDLTSALLLDPEDTAAITSHTEPHIDDLPAVEYESGRIVDREGSWFLNFAMLSRRLSPLSRAFEGGDPARLLREEQVRSDRIRDHMASLTQFLRRRHAAASGIR